MTNSTTSWKRILSFLSGSGKFWVAVAVLGLALLGGGIPGARAATTGFTNGFDGVEAGETLELRWEGVEEKLYPLCVTAQVMQKGGDGSVTVFKANLTGDIKGNSFAWKGVPFPLTFIPDGMYQLEIHPADGAPGGSGWPLLVKSPFFSITKASEPAKPSSSSSPDQKNGGGSNASKSLAIGLGVAIGVPSVVALALVSWCFKRKRRRALLERRRRTRRDFVIS